jgi:hypothetical protein
MKKLFSLLLMGVFSAFVFFACQKDNSQVPTKVTDDVLSQISSMGFSTEGVQAMDGGYLVEGDIFLSPEQLGQKDNGPRLIIAKEEQYRTTNLVAALPRTITVSLDRRLARTAGYSQALQEMVNRYNALNLQLRFQVVSSGATISFVRGSGSYLASAGFPTSTGNPHNRVTVNSTALGQGTSSTFINYLATVLAHELGHCIGFRHTDYMNRAFSCGGSATNEGASTVGAILIPGTPSGPDAGSWMLACIGSGQNRPFNTNDRTALDFLY